MGKRIHFRTLSALLPISSVALLAACGGGNNRTNIAAPAPPVAPSPPPAAEPIVPTFVDRTQAVGLMMESGFTADYTGMPSLFSGGAAIGDVDGDGDLDLFVTRGNAFNNRLLINDGGTFSVSSANPALTFPNGGAANFKLSGPVFADMDGDDHLDLFIGGLDGDPAKLFKGDGTGNFTDVTAGSGLDVMTSKNTISASLGDYDGDGDLDLAMAHWGTPRDASNPGETETLWRNDSAGGVIRFVSVSDPAGISSGLDLTVEGKIGRDHDYSFVPSFVDIDEDGDLDLLLVSDFRSSRVFTNNGDGTFTNATDTTQIIDSNGMGTDIGDVNQDGRPDWFVSSINANVLYRNMSGSMIPVQNSGAETGAWGWGSCFADFNLDGELDIYQTNGWVNNTGSSAAEPYDEDRTRLWIGEGDETYSDKAEDAGIADNQQGRAVICADFDNDRDTDILLLINGSSNGAIYWENRTPNTRAVSVRLIGPDGNKAAIGARVSLSAGGATQTQWVRVGSTFTAQTSPHLLFGLGASATPDQITVDWPDGAQTIVNSVSANEDVIVSRN